MCSKGWIHLVFASLQITFTGFTGLWPLVYLFICYHSCGR